MSALLRAPVWLWLACFVALPAAVLAVLSLATPAQSVPPFTLGHDLATFTAILDDSLYLDAALASLRIAASAALACLLIGYPMALAIARSAPARRPLLLLLVILPFWSGFLLRITAWVGILRDEGWLNAVLGFLGIAPLQLLHTEAAMQIGLVYCYLPFMILPLQARLAAADPALEQAAADLGASPSRAFWRVTFPLSLPGVWAGLALVFIPVAGEVVIPELLGGPDALTFGRMVWDEFFGNHDWPRAAALALALLAVLLAPAFVLGARART